MTFKNILFALFAVAVFGAAGVFLHVATHDQWVQGQFLLSRRRSVPRLITYAANPTEFALRCLFVGSLGGMFASMAFAGAVGLILRVVSLFPISLAGTAQARVAVALMLVPLACFLVWMGLIVYLPMAYE